MRGNGRYLAAASALALICSGVLADQARAQASTKGTTIDELIVTAERRAQNLQTTAISATVLDQKTLEAKGVVGLTTLQYAAPGLQISDYSSANTFNIRGIGQAQVDIDLPSGVVIYRDGVPTLTGYFQNAPYYDIASVEVLRGPQGTFVGKSAAAGAVFIRTRDPELGVTNGELTAGVGNRNFYEGTIVFNGAVSDTFSMRVAYHGEFRHSLFDSITSNPLPGTPKDKTAAGAAFSGGDHRELHSIRIGLRWKPTDNFDAIFKTDYDHLDFGCHCTSGFVPTTGAEEGPEQPDRERAAHLCGQGRPLLAEPELHLRRGWLLKSLTGFSTVKTRADWDVNGSNPAPFIFRSGGKFTNYSEEVDILSPADKPLRFTGGIFAQRYVNDIPQFPQPGLGFYTDNSQNPLLVTNWKRNDKTLGIFGQAAYDITEALELQLGVRWTHFEFDQFSQAILLPRVLNLPFNEPPGGVKANLDEKSVDWKVNLNYELSDSQFLYALVSRGHTPGSVNVLSTAVSPGTKDPYKEMEVINYEGGLEGHLHGRPAAHPAGGLLPDLQELPGRLRLRGRSGHPAAVDGVGIPQRAHPQQDLRRGARRPGPLRRPAARFRRRLLEEQAGVVRAAPEHLRAGVRRPRGHRPRGHDHAVRAEVHRQRRRRLHLPPTGDGLPGRRRGDADATRGRRLQVHVLRQPLPQPGHSAGKRGPGQRLDPLRAGSVVGEPVGDQPVRPRVRRGQAERDRRQRRHHRHRLHGPAAPLRPAGGPQLLILPPH
jgi:iron complex outermembrane receptor protein